MTAHNRLPLTRGQQGDNQAVIPSNVEGSNFTSRYSHGNGFTLVELAIAMMVIGLLIGGVLKGQELIRNARMTATIRQINDYETATLIFYNTYNALPGDLKQTNKLNNCDTDPCQLQGDGNGQISLCGDTCPEALNFWIHLDRAGLVSGVNEPDPYTSFQQYTTASPKTPDGGHMIMRYLSDYNNLNYWFMARKVLFAKTLDMKIDDGKPLSGKVLVYHTPSTCYDADEEIYLENPNAACSFMIYSESAN